MIMAKKSGPRPSRVAEVYRLHLEHPEMSHGAIAAEVGVSRQRVSKLLGDLRRPVATGSDVTVADQDHEKQVAALSRSGPQLATVSNALERQRLLDLAGNEQLEVLIDKVLRGSAPRAAAIAVGIESREFTRRMERDEHFRSLVLRAAHEAESSVAQNLYRLGTGMSPQAAQSAIAWLEKRMEDWRPNAQRIEVEVSRGVDVNYILANPKLIELENELEAARQVAEEAALRGLPAPKSQVIAAELVQLPKDPQDDLMAS